VALVSEIAVQYLCTVELPHVCAVSCIAQHGNILGYSRLFSERRVRMQQCVNNFMISCVADFLTKMFSPRKAMECNH